MNCFAGIHGHASPQPIVTTASKGANCFTSSKLLLSCLLRSYPNSFIAAIAFGFTMPLGLLPALNASTLSPPMIFANAWLIWLLLLFSMQTNRTFFLVMIGFYNLVKKYCY